MPNHNSAVERGETPHTINPNQEKSLFDTADLSHIATSKSHEKLPTEEKVEALTEIICRSGDDPATRSAALLVLIAMVESSPHPRILAAVAKQVALARCWELNVCGMVKSQIAALEYET